MLGLLLVLHPSPCVQGPFAAVYYIWQNSEVPGSKVPVPTWILAFGGVGIVIGLATYGWHIMGLYGAKSVMISNSRGGCLHMCLARDEGTGCSRRTDTWAGFAACRCRLGACLLMPLNTTLVPAPRFCRLLH